MLIWCMRGSILNGILVCVCVCVWMSVWVEWRTERHNQPLPDFLLHIQQAGLWEACLCHLSADWCGQIPRYMRYKTHTHTHTLTMTQYNTRWSVNTQPRLCLFKYFLEVSCFNMKDLFVWCKMIFFWSLLWIIWIHEKLLEQNINTINWLPAYKKKMFTHEQLKMISPPCFLFCSAKQYIRFLVSFLELLLIPDHNNRPTWKLIQVMAQPSAWPA